ncbi:MAG: dihydrofolate reductase [Burkholderiaceae bacterium]
MMAARITLIAARARNGVIGRDNRIPWKIPGEQAYFKRVTTGHTIVMGRRTWESIGRPLPARRNIVISRDRHYAAPGAEVVDSLDDALALSADDGEIFIIGGAQLYALALPRADRILLTEIDAEFEGDTFFPPFDASQWRAVSREHHHPSADRAFAYSIVDYQR